VHLERQPALVERRCPPRLYLPSPNLLAARWLPLAAARHRKLALVGRALRLAQVPRPVQVQQVL
jgi:hypothetical protein